MLLIEAVDRYRSAHPSLTRGSVVQLEVAARVFSRTTLRTDLDELCEVAIEDFAGKLLLAGRAPRTVNGRIRTILTLWRWCYRRKLCPTLPCEWERIPEPKRIPRAWRSEELDRLLTACDAAPTRRTWTGPHWRALVLTAYDSGLRIGCLLNVPRDCLGPDGVLSVPAELQKGKVETQHRLHPETLHAIAQLPCRDRLFDWPYSRRYVWVRFRADVLVPAELPATRRDLFHKLRRTSYSLVYDKLGPQAATQHASHQQDLSRAYLDPSFVKRTEAVDVLPRPGAAKPDAPQLDRLAELVLRLNAADRQAVAALVERLVG